MAVAENCFAESFLLNGGVSPSLRKVRHFHLQGLKRGVFALNKVKMDQIGLKIDLIGIKRDKGLKVVFLEMFFDGIEGYPPPLQKNLPKIMGEGQSRFIN